MGVGLGVTGTWRARDGGRALGPGPEVIDSPGSAGPTS